jgi:hypothetical protein
MGRESIISPEWAVCNVRGRRGGRDTRAFLAGLRKVRILWCLFWALGPLGPFVKGFCHRPVPLSLLATALSSHLLLPYYSFVDSLATHCNPLIVSLLYQNFSLVRIAKPPLHHHLSLRVFPVFISPLEPLFFISASTFINRFVFVAPSIDLLAQAYPPKIAFQQLSTF